MILELGDVEDVFETLLYGAAVLLVLAGAALLFAVGYSIIRAM